MLWLAGLFGLMAVGGFAFGDILVDSDDENSDDDLPDTPTSGKSASLENTPIFSAFGLDPDQPVGETIIGDQSNQHLSGGEGDDQINGYDGDDTIDGASGRDDLYGGNGNDKINGGDGADSLHGQDLDDILLGGAGNDNLYGHNDDDQLNGDAGDDTLHGGMGDDLLFGGKGDDAVHGGIGDDTLYGGEGQDTLFGGAGDDVLMGVSPNDGTPDSDVDFLNGGSGDDVIVAGETDIVTAGDGADTVIFGDWITKDAPAILMDYDAAEDQLIVVWDLQSSPDPDIEVVADDSVAGLSHILVDGVEIAAVTGNQTVKVSDIILVDHSDMGFFGSSAA
ncbi:MAG: calcium-binding protein [Rhodobacteraceae bacterium]|nr:calcium-binding protein [Paracoccaceae bacterium]